jgi:hypothetical protein
MYNHHHKAKAGRAAIDIHSIESEDSIYNEVPCRGE